MYPRDIIKLKVSDIHTISVKTYGTQSGNPIVLLHGGPGGVSDPVLPGLFNLKKTNIITFDQRGCGESTPFGSVEENTIWTIIEDMEVIRKKLNIEKWSILGGSWGTTVGLAYGISYPRRCTSFILRSIFLCRKKDLEWLFSGARKFFPDKYSHSYPDLETFFESYWKRLNSKEQTQAASEWMLWEGSLSTLKPNIELLQQYSKSKMSISGALLGCHYFRNNGFLKESWILDNIDQISHIPCHIIQGRYDMVCTVEPAWDLHSLWPGSRLTICESSGHSTFEEEIQKALSKSIEIFQL